MRQAAPPYPEIDLREPPPREPRPVEATAFVEELPRVCGSLVQLWGTSGFDDYLNRLIIDERGTRQGFSLQVMDELLFLGSISRRKARLVGTSPPLKHPQVK
jgi:hypothetical protein